MAGFFSANAVGRGEATLEGAVKSSVTASRQESPLSSEIRRQGSLRMKLTDPSSAGHFLLYAATSSP